MATVHMSEAEVMNDLAAVLAQVRQGSEIIIENGDKPIAVIKPTISVGRVISEVITHLEVRVHKQTDR